MNVETESIKGMKTFSWAFGGCFCLVLYLSNKCENACSGQKFPGVCKVQLTVVWGKQEASVEN